MDTLQEFLLCLHAKFEKKQLKFKNSTSPPEYSYVRHYLEATFIKDNLSISVTDDKHGFCLKH